jgi:uncharacterized FlgJ-related protein
MHWPCGRWPWRYARRAMVHINWERGIFPVFHVSQLKKYLRVLKERIEPQGIQIKADLEYREQPVRVLDTKDRVTRNKVVTTYKIQWSHHDENDATWETGEYLKIFTTSGS